jgi:hypothetical protein
MDFSTLLLRTDPKKKAHAKTRVFSVQLLGLLTADSLWEPGSAGTRSSLRRPVWIAYAGTESASQAFTNNFRNGRKAGSGHENFEIPKRSGHRFSVQKVSAGLITVAYLPEGDQARSMIP